MNERTLELVLSTIPSPSGTVQDSSPGAQAAPFPHCRNQHSKGRAGDFPRASQQREVTSAGIRPGVVTQRQRDAQNCLERQP